MLLAFIYEHLERSFLEVLSGFWRSRQYGTTAHSLEVPFTQESEGVQQFVFERDRETTVS